MRTLRMPLWTPRMLANEIQQVLGIGMTVGGDPEDLSEKLESIAKQA